MMQNSQRILLERDTSNARLSWDKAIDVLYVPDHVKKNYKDVLGRHFQQMSDIIRTSPEDATAQLDIIKSNISEIYAEVTKPFIERNTVEYRMPDRKAIPPILNEAERLTTRVIDGINAALNPLSPRLSRPQPVEISR
jgi:hypothetical protein